VPLHCVIGIFFLRCVRRARLFDFHTSGTHLRSRFECLAKLNWPQESKFFCTGEYPVTRRCVNRKSPRRQSWIFPSACGMDASKLTPHDKAKGGSSQIIAFACRAIHEGNRRDRKDFTYGSRSRTKSYFRNRAVSFFLVPRPEPMECHYLDDSFDNLKSASHRTKIAPITACEHNAALWPFSRSIGDFKTWTP